VLVFISLTMGANLCIDDSIHPMEPNLKVGSASDCQRRAGKIPAVGHHDDG
jgi:hypothetical protein